MTNLSALFSALNALHNDPIISEIHPGGGELHV